MLVPPDEMSIESPLMSIESHQMNKASPDMAFVFYRAMCFIELCVHVGSPDGYMCSYWFELESWPVCL